MRRGKRIWALVPVKTFARAKARLAPVLNAEQREELARVMLHDVLTSLLKVEELAGILVVSQDWQAKDIASRIGARTLNDPFETGPNVAIRLALPVLRDLGADALLVIPADVPQIDADELRPIVHALPQRCVALAPAGRDRGTNLLGCSPLDAIEPCFGPQSFAKHIAAAKRAGIEPLLVDAASFSQDLDRPEDVQTFHARFETNTGRFLRRVLRDEAPATCMQ
jgi:2-phospho-L-lactate/phosphoenolpyruvate guanylyltransferase